ncbi:bifunctional diguanylate cyclase/phosphodiesterase [Mariprofundus erugo]|uniref:putative bifunctional diguanylate cyclase/phosphodiesterase n=1 Tax=Mariprofundus erugo TaxID=2528639 RepID=UPI0010FDA193|nr:bifunctional diguanylate cyclase/phosphodiesterase [Mariprofundus erugo]TLS74477.1 bifunctional diguanylate cyclase/phosphodiesterase [Mariprofundus erugo]
MFSGLTGTAGDSSRNIHERNKGVRYFALVFVPAALIFGAVDLWLGHPLVAGPLLGSAIAIIGCLRLSPTDKVSRCEHVIMLSCTTIALGLICDGGMMNSGIYWVLLYPFLAFFISGQRQGWYWLATLVTSTTVLAIMQWQSLIHLAYSGHHLLYGFTTFFFFALIAAGLNQLKHRYERLLEVQLGEQSRTAMGYLERLEYLALYDALTDLPNRNLARDRLAQAIEEASRASGSFALGYLDIEHFSEINTLLGEHKSDQVLKMAAKRLKSIVRGVDTVARLEGDEFLMIWSGVNEASIHIVVNKTQQCMEEPFILDGTAINIPVRLGVVIYPQHGHSVNDLLQHARTVHRRVKTEQIRYLLYQSEWHSEALRRVHLLSRMREAIDNHVMQLHYQPQVSLKDGTLCGVEALLRWPDDREGYISPAEFIPLAERSRFIEELTFMTIDMAARQDQLWRQAGLDIQMSVNLSARNLIDLHLPEKIGACLQYYEHQAHHFMLEITESDIMTHPDLALSVMQRLSDMGIRLSIDDFGTGYSSLTYLRKLPMNELKIDQSFIRDYMRNESDRKIVATIYSLAHTLNLHVVAEGVEDADTWQALSTLGVDIAQGYLIKRALPADELLIWAQSLDSGRFRL